MKKGIILSIAGILIATLITALLVRTWQKRFLREKSSVNEKIVYIFERNGCLSCHSDEAKLPFYASFPLIKKEIAKHVQHGTRYIDLENICKEIQEGKTVSYINLAKIEQSAIKNSMPIAMYTTLHWQSILSKEEREILRQWAKEERLKQMPNILAVAEFKDEMLHPIPDQLNVDSAKVPLGFALFHDTRLSKDNTISCASCHALDNLGCDTLQFSKGIYDQIGGINAPTVFNAAFHFAQFWDGRLPDLQAQAGGPPFDALEMGSENWDEICAKLNQDKEFLEKFKKVYPEGFNGHTVTDAIAEFEKTLITPNSRFDKFLKGDKEALSEEEKKGFQLFKDHNCATCHAGPAMGGLSFEYMSIFGNYLSDRSMKADREIIRIKDQGHYNLTENEKDLQRYKVPSLRNIEHTFPYLHDGTATTLEEAVRIMYKYELGKKPKDKEVKSMLAFLKTLNGEYMGKPLK